MASLEIAVVNKEFRQIGEGQRDPPPARAGQAMNSSLSRTGLLSLSDQVA